ncbi:cholesterol oxidase substrate-binding domain-containing protein [Streptacidiphilus neutrinimicus]|uniref:cholesterol oxidase substrate-binding domain-containing protein n=1 Tax=Streptacidiphilus neutrinimicus TaxID=105420 RepID=UPI0005A961F8|nr:cholesterol oxidase substrate-binding domain-containing protein [Streptacidiphilus neutrinimicus]
MDQHDRARLSRRAFLGATAAGAALGAVSWTPAFRVTPAEAATAAPPNLPASIPVYQQAFRNWSGEIQLNPTWTCAPTSPNDVVTLANWANANGWRLRAMGMGHGWSPLLEPSGAAGDILLVDTTQHLTAVTVNSGSPASVTAQAGITMVNLLTTLENAGYGLTNTPAPGDLTLGGVLAIDGHGTSVPANGETPLAGKTYGSVSNLVVSLTAVVWDPGSGAYVLKTFQRSDPDIGAFLVHLGRAFVTEATLRVGANQRLRCVSTYTTQVTDLFAPPASAGSSSFAALVQQSGRVETIWFPFTTVPWLKVWSVSPSRSWLSREVDSPFNYSFSDSVSSQESQYISDIVAGNVSVTPTFENLEMSIVGSGLIVTGTWDIWGWAKNTQLYVRPTTLQVTANGYTILCRRADIQRVVSEFYSYLSGQLSTYAAAGQYPMNGPWEVRVTGLDHAADCGVPGAVEPLLSALRPRPDQPQWDTAVWMDLLTIPGTPQSQQFYRQTEQWVLSNYTGSYAAVRAEWSKGWAYSGTAAWADPTVLGSTIPASYRAGQPGSANWDTAVATLDRYDPGRVFSNSFLDTLLP